MRSRNEGQPPEVPARFLRENAPGDRQEFAAWSNERVAWYRANGYSVLKLIQEDQAARNAARSRR